MSAVSWGAVSWSALLAPLLAGGAVLVAPTSDVGVRLRATAPAPAAVPAGPASRVSAVVIIDLVCAALAAGLPTAAAVAAAVEAVGGGAGRSSLRWPAGDDARRAVDQAMALADRTGASAVALLGRAAADQRAARRRAVAAATGRLGVRLVLPLGLAVLPAFVLLGVAPVVLGLAHELLSGT